MNPYFIVEICKWAAVRYERQHGFQYFRWFLPQARSRRKLLQHQIGLLAKSVKLTKDIT